MTPPTTVISLAWVIEAYVENAHDLDLYCLEETHSKNTRVSNVYIDQQANSELNHDVITLQNGVTRNKLDLVFRARVPNTGRDDRHCR